MTNKPNVTSKFEEERLRAAEQSQIVYLQGQLDELRRLLKEQTNKYNWAMEQMRKVEASVAQIDGLFERQRQDVTQTLDSYRRDIAMLRKEMAGALLKIEEGVKPIREMQTQIHQLGEARKQDRDHVAGWLVRIEDIERRTLTWNAQFKEAEDRHRALASQLETLFAADEGVRAEVRKLYEDFQIEKQSLRRQAVEAQQLVADVRSILDDHHSRIMRLDEIRQHLELFSEQIPAQIGEAERKLADQAGELKRIERIATERFLMNQERLEEVRKQQDEKVLTLQETDEQHLRQLTGWLERVDGWVRELEQRMERTITRFELNHREHATQLSTLERRDIEMLDALLGSLRQRAEQIKAEQIEQGRPGATS